MGKCARLCAHTCTCAQPAWALTITVTPPHVQGANSCTPPPTPAPHLLGGGRAQLAHPAHPHPALALAPSWPAWVPGPVQLQSATGCLALGRSWANTWAVIVPHPSPAGSCAPSAQGSTCCSSVGLSWFHCDLSALGWVQVGTGRPREGCPGMVREKRSWLHTGEQPWDLGPQQLPDPVWSPVATLLLTCLPPGLMPCCVPGMGIMQCCASPGGRARGSHKPASVPPPPSTAAFPGRWWVGGPPPCCSGVS